MLRHDDAERLLARMPKTAAAVVGDFGYDCGCGCGYGCGYGSDLGLPRPRRLRWLPRLPRPQARALALAGRVAGRKLLPPRRPPLDAP